MPPGQITVETIVLDVVPASTLPDADTDVLIWYGGDPDATLGAYIGDDSDGPQWCNVDGEIVTGVTHWAKMPSLLDRAPGRQYRDFTGATRAV